ncbi:Pentatricopeptide repeat-containing protein [Clarias magur]|uniref:Pentatricopeptide repeat-containing protein n=1 Tax=Clarias magur TaxID=1594786 RepID=A0A8J4TP62_CLAMG|nr:Pentatricopeptide repeat-containing protein [Clarias magur]
MQTGQSLGLCNSHACGQFTCSLVQAGTPLPHGSPSSGSLREGLCHLYQRSNSIPSAPRSSPVQSTVCISWKALLYCYANIGSRSDVQHAFLHLWHIPSTVKTTVFTK